MRVCARARVCGSGGVGRMQQGKAAAAIGPPPQFPLPCAHAPCAGVMDCNTRPLTAFPRRAPVRVQQRHRRLVNADPALERQSHHLQERARLGVPEVLCVCGGAGCVQEVVVVVAVPAKKVNPVFLCFRV